MDLYLASSLYQLVVLCTPETQIQLEHLMYAADFGG